MNTDFILPNKWYIKITDDNREIVNNWKINQEYPSSLFNHLDYIVVSSDGCGDSSCDVVISDNETEITTEQFISHVLKQQPDNIPKQLENLDYLIPLFKELNIK